MLKPVEYSFLTPEDMGNVSQYQRVATRLRLDKSNSGGYGLLHCVDELGERWTAITLDVEYLRTLVAGVEPEVLGGLEVPEAKFAMRRRGWPDEW